MAVSSSDLVVTTAGVAFASTMGALYYERKLGRDKLPKAVLGAFGIGLILSLINSASDQVGRALCWLIIIGALSYNGARIVAARGK